LIFDIRIADVIKKKVSIITNYPSNEGE